MTLANLFRSGPTVDDLALVIQGRPWVLSATALLCLEDDCGALFTADGGACPRCGSHESMPAARALNRATPADAKLRGVAG